MNIFESISVIKGKATTEITLIQYVISSIQKEIITSFWMRITSKRICQANSGTAVGGGRNIYIFIFIFFSFFSVKPLLSTNFCLHSWFAKINRFWQVKRQSSSWGWNHWYILQGVFLVLSKVICLFGRLFFILKTIIGSHMNSDTGGFWYSMWTGLSDTSQK